MPLIHSRIRGLSLDTDFEIIRCVPSELQRTYFLCDNEGQTGIYEHDEIVDYFRENIMNKGW